jgi:hypothetical protein
MNEQEGKKKSRQSDQVKAHYDFDYSKAKPNRFAARLAQEQVMVVLDPDMAAVFPTSEAVNEALRVLAAAAKNLSSEKPKRQRKVRASVTQVAA